MRQKRKALRTMKTLMNLKLFQNGTMFYWALIASDTQLWSEMKMPHISQSLSWWVAGNWDRNTSSESFSLVREKTENDWKMDGIQSYRNLLGGRVSRGPRNFTQFQVHSGKVWKLLAEVQNLEDHTHTTIKNLRYNRLGHTVCGVQTTHHQQKNRSHSPTWTFS